MQLRTSSIVFALAIALSQPLAAQGISPQCPPGTATPGDLLLALTGAPDRAVAAGIHFEGGTGRPLVVRAEGDAWTRLPIPVRAGAGTIQLQDAVTVGDRTWAVGSLHNDTPMAGWLQGDRWRWSDPIDPGGIEDELLGVALEYVPAHARGHFLDALTQTAGGRAG